jgi:NADH-quinone oxidoreductase subunit J
VNNRQPTTDNRQLNTVTAFDIFFYLFALITGISAMVAVLAKNIVHAAFSLLFTFMGVAGIYVLLHADFLAVTQILVYVGGILVLLVFGVMLTNKVTDINIKAGTKSRIPAALLTIVIASVLGFVILTTRWTSHNEQPWKNTQVWNTNIIEKVEATGDKGPQKVGKGSAGTAEHIGTLMLTDHLLPFEAVSILLLIALMGAAMLARRAPVNDESTANSSLPSTLNPAERQS